MLLAKISAFIHRHQLCKKSDVLLVAASGGKDSTALLHALHSLGYQLVVAHCHFGLRGNDADEDAAFVKATSQKWGLRCLVKHFNTLVEQAKGESIQMTARRLRYDWFHDVCQQEQLAGIATAHTANDQTETILYQWAKGTGLRGMGGMLPKNDLVLRPMLSCTTDEVLAYLQEHQLQHRHDASNDSTYYRRNKLRHEVLPLLQEINPSLNTTVGENSAYLQSAQAFIAQQSEKLQQQHWTTEQNAWRIPKNALRDVEGSGIIWYEWLRPYGFNSTQIRNLLENAETGAKIESASYTLFCDRAAYLLEKRLDIREESARIIDQKAGSMVIGEHRLQWQEWTEKPALPLLKQASKAFLDLAEIQLPLTLRLWQEGDVFQPFGMKGQSQKVSDFLINQKVPLPAKKRQWLLVDATGSICWIVGRRVDERFALKSDTKHMLIFDWT